MHILVYASANPYCRRCFVCVVCVCVCVKLLQLQLCPTLCDSTDCSMPGACQAPLSMGFSREEYWSGLPCPPLGALPDPGMEPMSPALEADFYHLKHQGWRDKEIQGLHRRTKGMTSLGTEHRWTATTHLLLEDGVACIRGGWLPPFIISQVADGLEAVFEVFFLFVEAAGPAFHVLRNLGMRVVGRWGS